VHQPEKGGFVTQRIEKLLRLLIALLIALIVLAVSFETDEPAVDIKRFLLCAGAAVIGIIHALGLLTGWLPFRCPRHGALSVSGFLIFMGIAALRSPLLMASISAFSLFAAMALLYFTASQVYRRPDQMTRFMAAFCGAVALMSIYGFLQKAGLDPLPWAGKDTEHYAGMPATMGNPNFAAHCLLPAILMAFYFLFSGGRDKQSASWMRRLAALFLLLLFGSHLIFTGQRAALVALAAASVLVAGMAIGRRLTAGPRAALAAGIALSVLAAALITGGVFYGVYARTGGLLPVEDSILLRYQSLVSTARMVEDRPLSGFGPGMFRVRNPGYWTAYEQEWASRRQRMNMHTHNEPLELAAEGGLPAAACYMSLVFFLAGAALYLAVSVPDPRRRRLALFFAAFFTAFFIDSCFGFNLHVTAPGALFFVLTGIFESPPGGQRKNSGAARRVLRPAAAMVLLAACAGMLLLHGRILAASFHLREARVCQSAGKDNRARHHLDRAGALTPWDWHVSRRTGRLELARGNPAAARAAYEKVFTLNPWYFPARVPLGRAKYRQILNAVAEKPDTVLDHITALEAAEQEIRAVLSFTPQHAAAEELLGDCAAARAMLMNRAPSPDSPGRTREYWHEAEAHYAEALRFHDVPMTPLRLKYARILTALKKTDAALDVLTRAADRDPGSMEIWTDFFAFAVNENRFDAIQQALRNLITETLAREKTDQERLCVLNIWLAAVLAAGYDAFEPADQAWRDAAAANPASLDLWSSLNSYARKYGREKTFEAILTGTRLAEAPGIPALPPHVRALSAVYLEGPEALGPAAAAVAAVIDVYRRDNTADARDACYWTAARMARMLEGKDTGRYCAAYYNLARAFAKLGDYRTANALFGDAFYCVDEELRPETGLLWADTMTRLNRHDSALQLLQDIHETYPGSIAVHRALARLLLRLDHKDAAGKAYEDLLARDDLPEAVRRAVKAEAAAF
jgi:O-antigen ligase/tetratricopeptide (TPR) repeat protein